MKIISSTDDEGLPCYSIHVRRDQVVVGIKVRASDMRGAVIDDAVIDLWLDAEARLALQIDWDDGGHEDVQMVASSFTHLIAGFIARARDERLADPGEPVPAHYRDALARLAADLGEAFRQVYRERLKLDLLPELGTDLWTRKEERQFHGIPEGYRKGVCIG
jgi:hypothetical protein